MKANCATFFCLLNAKKTQEKRIIFYIERQDQMTSQYLVDRYFAVLQIISFHCERYIYVPRRKYLLATSRALSIIDNNRKH